MFNLFKKKSLSEKVNETKKVKIEGVLFEIRKINVLTLMAGHQVLFGDVYFYEDKKKINNSKPLDNKKVIDHYVDVFLAGVVKPKLSKKDTEGHINVNDIFNDPSLYEKLYTEIVGFTYGKKKMNFGI